MARYPHPSTFSLPSESAQLSDVNVQSARTWQWGTGRPITKTQSSGMNTQYRFDNDFGTQTYPRFENEFSTQTWPRFDNERGVQTNTLNTRTRGTDSPSTSNKNTSTQTPSSTVPTFKELFLMQDRQLSLPMSPYERYMQDLVNPRPVRFPNGGAISSGVNAWENEHMYGRVQQYQESQNALDRAQALQMQQSGFQNQRDMQSSSQAFERDQANRAFDYQRTLQQNGFDFQSGMQGREFQQQRYLQDRSFEQQTNMQNSAQSFQQGQAERQYGYSRQLNSQNIMGNLANTATSGLFGVATEGIHELGEYLNNKSNQNFQERMNPTLFQQQKELQGASIKGNLENTGIQALSNFAVSALTTAAGVWMNNSNQEFQQAQAARNFNNQAYIQGLSANALKLATN